MRLLYCKISDRLPLIVLLSSIIFLLTVASGIFFSLTDYFDKPVAVVKIDPSIASKFQKKGWTMNIATHVYEYESKPPLWLYWDTAPYHMSAHICLSLKTIHCQNHKDFSIKLVTNKTFHHYIEDIHPAFHYLIPAHRADYFRIRTLQEYGGVYIDIDGIALKSFQNLYNYLGNYDIVTHSDLPDNISTVFLGPVRSQHPVFRTAAVKIHNLLDKKYDRSFQSPKHDVLGWTELLSTALIPTFHALLKNNTINPMIFNGRSTIIQLVINYPNPLIRANSIEDILKRINLSQTPYLCYHNSGLKEHLKNHTEDALLKSDTIIGHVFRLALQNCTQPLPSCYVLQKLYMGHFVP